MAKVTSKLQITLPKALATQYGIAPGDEIRFEGVSGAIRLIPAKQSSPRLSLEERVRLFEESNQRLKDRHQWLLDYVAAHPNEPEPEGGEPGDIHGRGWTRDSLYDRKSLRRWGFGDGQLADGQDEPDQ